MDNSKMNLWVITLVQVRGDSNDFSIGDEPSGYSEYSSYSSSHTSGQENSASTFEGLSLEKSIGMYNPCERRRRKRY